ncbi:hypothetical protein B9Z55_014552 [Caenorhabditis nigoni]|uniref:Uncharacterized protein n=1 Tax=Caenorhabditis nigoni TaxID=1611254 RepID=A0A2G5U6W1_9PELO|nr:hypothetical protein B9Z55_014552 [Caenorhabditis nigoni]
MKEILQEASDAHELAIKCKAQVVKNDDRGGVFEVTIDKSTITVSKEHFHREVVEAPIRLGEQMTILRKTQSGSIGVLQN